jgi:hypothetical protein
VVLPRRGDPEHDVLEQVARQVIPRLRAEATTAN